MQSLAIFTGQAVLFEWNLGHQVRCIRCVPPSTSSVECLTMAQYFNGWQTCKLLLPWFTDAFLSSNHIVFLFLINHMEIKRKDSLLQNKALDASTEMAVRNDKVDYRFLIKQSVELERKAINFPKRFLFFQNQFSKLYFCPNPSLTEMWFQCQEFY